MKPPEWTKSSSVQANHNRCAEYCDIYLLTDSIFTSNSSNLVTRRQPRQIGVYSCYVHVSIVSSVSWFKSQSGLRGHLWNVSHFVHTCTQIISARFCHNQQISRVWPKCVSSLESFCEFLDAPSVAMIGSLSQWSERCLVGSNLNCVQSLDQDMRKTRWHCNCLVWHGDRQK